MTLVSYLTDRKDEVAVMMKGSYLLLISLGTDQDIEVGRLGKRHFPSGTYLYCGSALNGVISRVGRHFDSRKKLHWHIDYLLQEAEVYGALIFLDERRLECRIRSILSQDGSVSIPVKGFGSSDCSCLGHLLYLADEEYLEPLIKRLLETISSD